MNTKRYDTVDALVLDAAGKEAVDAMNQHAEETRVIHALVSIRNDKGRSQRQQAKEMGYSPSKLCRIEAGRDADLTLGEIEAYARALGLSVHLSFDDASLPAAAQIKRHVFLIKERLDGLAELAAKQNDDSKLVKKIHEFYGEVLINFAMRFGDSYQKIPPVITVGAEPAKPATPAPYAEKRLAAATR
jgi:transcriptional regulator with XRE-family HTH domain